MSPPFRNVRLSPTATRTGSMLFSMLMCLVEFSILGGTTAEEKNDTLFSSIYATSTLTGVSLEAGYRRSTAAYVASHRRLLNLTFKRVVVVISSTETTMSLCTSYFNSQLYSRLLITYGRLLKKIMKPLTLLCVPSSRPQNRPEPGSFPEVFEVYVRRRIP